MVARELEQVQQTKSHLQESVCELVKNVDNLSFDAEEKNDLRLLSRSNDLDKLAENLYSSQGVQCLRGVFYSLICYSSLDYDGTTI